MSFCVLSSNFSKQSTTCFLQNIASKFSGLSVILLLTSFPKTAKFVRLWGNFASMYWIMRLFRSYSARSVWKSTVVSLSDNFCFSILASSFWSTWSLTTLVPSSLPSTKMSCEIWVATFLWGYKVATLSRFLAGILWSSMSLKLKVSFSLIIRVKSFSRSSSVAVTEPADIACITKSSEHGTTL